jgi:hypothetical protein
MACQSGWRELAYVLVVAPNLSGFRHHPGGFRPYQELSERFHHIAASL